MWSNLNSKSQAYKDPKFHLSFVLKSLQLIHSSHNNPFHLIYKALNKQASSKKKGTVSQQNKYSKEAYSRKRSTLSFWRNLKVQLWNL